MFTLHHPHDSTSPTPTLNLVHTYIWPNKMTVEQLKIVSVSWGPNMDAQRSIHIYSQVPSECMYALYFKTSSTMRKSYEWFGLRSVTCTVQVSIYIWGIIIIIILSLAPLVIPSFNVRCGLTVVDVHQDNLFPSTEPVYTLQCNDRKEPT